MLVVMRSGMVFIVLLSSAAGQIVTLEPEPLPSKAPHAAPERRRKLAVDPDTLLSQLLSKDIRQRRSALDQLDMSWLGESGVSDVRLIAVNLDADPDLERVLIVRGNRDAASILKEMSGAWWEIGAFLHQGHHAFLEVETTVWPGTNDVIVRSGGSQGTGVGEVDLSIYRIWHGRLYRVLQIVENAYNFTGSVESTVTYPVLPTSGAPAIIVHQTNQTGQRRDSKCLAYRWDLERFAFVPTACRAGQ